jgi:hypothetical protein
MAGLVADHAADEKAHGAKAGSGKVAMMSGQSLHPFRVLRERRADAALLDLIARSGLAGEAA